VKLALAALLACAVTLGACHAAQPDDKAFGERVRAYLLAHPEVIQEAVDRLQAKATADEEAAQRQAKADLPRFRQAIERDPRDFAANPAGKITVTEFYDYRCPHCINAAPKVVALIRANPDIRFVFKEMPIFGPTSEHAARAALAVKKSGGDYVGAYEALMAARPLDIETIDRIARAKGAAAADLKTVPAVDLQLGQTSDLFNKLNLGGTPAFIVGDEIVYGEDMEALATAIAKARAGG